MAPKPQGDPASARMNGASIRPMLEWLAATYGSEAVVQIAHDLGPRWTIGIRVDETMLRLSHTHWYDETFGLEILEHAIAHAVDHGATRQEALAGIAAAMFDRMIARSVRALDDWFSQPETLTAKLQMFWRAQHTHGTLSARIDGETMHLSNIGWLHHTTAGCELAAACIVCALERSGRAGVRVDHQLCHGGARPCEAVFRWSA